MFFQRRALTVGIIKKGEINITRAIPLPLNVFWRSIAIRSPRTTEMEMTLPTRIRLLITASGRAGSVKKNS